MNPLEQAWLEFLKRFEQAVGTGVVLGEAEKIAYRSAFMFGALTWNRMLIAAGEDEEQRTVLGNALLDVLQAGAAGRDTLLLAKTPKGAM